MLLVALMVGCDDDIHDVVNCSPLGGITKCERPCAESAQRSELPDGCIATNPTGVGSEDGIVTEFECPPDSVFEFDGHAGCCVVDETDLLGAPVRFFECGPVE